MQTSAVTYKIERYTIDQLESKIKTYGKTMSKKKSKKIRKEQAQELSSAEPEHLKLAAEKQQPLQVTSRIRTIVSAARRL